MRIDEIKSFEDNLGTLLPLEFKTVGFKPERLFIVNNVPVGSIRGNHSHYNTKQFLICVRGEVRVFFDDGVNKKSVLLKRHEAVMIPELIWDSQEFLTEGTEILVICSTEYDIDDYILDYTHFKSIVIK